MRRIPLLNRRYGAVAASVVALGGVGVGVAQATKADPAPTPPPKSLPAALLDVMQAPRIQGLTAHVEITNRLLPGAAVQAGGAAFAEHVEGDLRLAGDGSLRADLRSDAGAAQLTAGEDGVTLYDESTDTEYVLPLPELPAAAPAGAPGAMSAAAMPELAGALGDVMKRFEIDGAEPGSIAGRPAYTARITPRDDGGLLGAAEISWDAERGVPLRAAVYAQGDDEPAFEVEVTEISYDPVRAADVRPDDHPGAREVRLASGTAAATAGTPPRTASGVANVQRRLGFPLSAPAELAGLPRTGVHLVEQDGRAAAVSTYGEGLGMLVVTQTDAPDGGLRPGDDVLTRVNIDGRTGVELANPLGTMVGFERGGVAYVVAGLVPPVAAENAARGL